MKVDGDTVNDVGKEPKPVESMPSSTVERDEARTGEVLAGKPAVCDEASKMEVDTAAASAQAIVKSAADTVRCCSCLLYIRLGNNFGLCMHSLTALALQPS